ncbi:MAG: hypothetical protein NC421_07250 [Lachnospiraceae bacterium]|nr:hypothetical protein [Lachnospiraceae bacterium]
MEFQFESFTTTNGEIVIVNKATITYIRKINGYNCRIYFNSPGFNNTVQSVDIDCTLEELEKILNGE